MAPRPTRNAGGWPACPYDRRKVQHVTTPEYERMMRQLRHLRDNVLPRLEFLVHVYQLNDAQEAHR